MEVMRIIMTGLTVEAAAAGAVVRFSAPTEVFQILFSKGIERAMEVMAFLTSPTRGQTADRAGTEEECMP